MYYYHSLSYGREKNGDVRLLGKDIGMEQDPYFQWKLDRPMTSGAEQIAYISRVRLAACRALFSILAHFAQKFCAKASLLIDYFHQDCTLQLSRLDDLSFQGVEKDLLLYVFLHTHNIRLDPIDENTFAITMEYKLFETIAGEEAALEKI